MDQNLQDLRRQFQITGIDPLIYLNACARARNSLLLEEVLERPDGRSILMKAAFFNEFIYKFLEEHPIGKIHAQFPFANHDWDKYYVDWQLENDLYVLMGANGSGKTRILKKIVEEQGGLYYHFGNMHNIQENQQDIAGNYIKTDGSNLRAFAIKHKDIVDDLIIEGRFPGGSQEFIDYFETESRGTLHYVLQGLAMRFAPKGSLVCIECPEISIHPFALRRIFEEADHNADDRIMIFTTQSEVFLDEFREFGLDNICVLEYGVRMWPVRLTALMDQQYIAHFSLGNLFARGDFGDSSGNIGHPLVDPEWRERKIQQLENQQVALANGEIE